MKRNLKKIILHGLCVCTIAFGTVGAVGCDMSFLPNKNPDTREETVEKEFSLNYHIYELQLYDTFQLKVKDYDGLTWSSDQPSVVSVDANGKVTANAYGTATVTVTCGTKTDSCIFTVPDEGIVPKILTNTGETGIALLNGDTFTLDCVIDFNGTQFTDAVFSFSSSDATTVSVNADGKIKAEKFGDAVVTVKASWRDFDEVYLTKNIPVTVNPDLSIELTSERNELSTVTEKINGKNYSNTCQIGYEVKVDGLDKTSETTLEWVSTNPTVATVSDGLVTAHARGVAEITAQYTFEGKTYVSLPVRIEAVAPVKNLNDSRFVYNVTSGEELQIENIQGDVYSVSTSAEDYTQYCEEENGTLTISATYLDALRGNADFVIETPVYSYVFEAVFATHAISSASELKAFFSSYYGNNDSNMDVNESTEDWYAVLTQDFSFAGYSVGHGSYGSRFRGVFDGMGHTVSDVTVTANGGMFGGLHGTIKNLAIDGITATQSNCFLLAGYLYNGTVENVFLRGSFAVASNCGFVRLGGGSVSNCIVDITYPEGGEGSAYGEKETETTTPENATVISNCYAIGNASQFRPYNSELPVYPTTEVFLEACGNAVIAENGFNEYWSGDEYGVNFGKTPVITLTASEKEKIVLLEDGALDAEALLGDSVDYVMIDNERVEISADGILQLKTADYTKGETHVVQIRGNGKIVKQPFVIPTHQIGTWTEFLDFLNSYNAEKENGAVNTASWYIILTADIDCGNNTYGMAGASYWRGTFNGMGHSVSNIRLWGQGGLLGRPMAGSVIENTAFLDIRTTSADTYLLTGYAQGGVVRNVYLQGEHCKVTTHGAMRNESSGRVENVIVNVQFAEGSTAAAYSKKGSVVLENAYAIGNATAYVEGDTTTPVYATVSDFLTAEKSNIKAENGWNEYWSFDADGNLYFADNKVE